MILAPAFWKPAGFQWNQQRLIQPMCDAFVSSDVTCCDLTYGTSIMGLPHCRWLLNLRWAAPCMHVDDAAHCMGVTKWKCWTATLSWSQHQCKCTSSCPPAAGYSLLWQHDDYCGGADNGEHFYCNEALLVTANPLHTVWQLCPVLMKQLPGNVNQLCISTLVKLWAERPQRCENADVPLVTFMPSLGVWVAVDVCCWGSISCSCHF